MMVGYDPTLRNFADFRTLNKAKHNKLALMGFRPPYITSVVEIHGAAV